MTTQLSIPENALAITETQPFTALGFTTRATLQTLSQHAPGVAESLYKEANLLGLTVTGPIHWLYTDVNGNETHEFQLEIVLPIAQPGAPSDHFFYKDYPSFRCATYTYTGPWSDFGAVYDALFGQFHRNGYQNDGRVREVYTVVDLQNQGNCITEIQIGL
ncbi:MULTISPECIES: GyrI-like domain-containing protein [unclassified Spirosoma]|uniref:GyrI-like domain-containing protein n=1 Tax=unclassified Spirosoma TaxID=2621999 RepID=UPI00095ABAAB|nr:MULTISPECIES: GyrI-like domain-containing protein [unclassified Spirosoma]MBN8823099.1 GyrI-like domain-containing protein [Spirosoma sp.]OJW73190.1 MAG: GyrI-like domain-containing protein [Spirosoma sp. 48-14]